MRSQFTQRIQLVDAAVARICADLDVESPALVADFAHVTQHKQLASGRACEHVDGGTHRVGVGVVGVVDQQRALPAAFDLQPALHRCKSGQRVYASFQRCAGGRGRRNGGQRIACIVFSGQRQIEDGGGFRGADARDATKRPAARKSR